MYDLKDHPDFQYRPGTVVIRVANFEGEDANCTAGQVLDNYPEGKVTAVSYVISILSNNFLVLILFDSCSLDCFNLATSLTNKNGPFYVFF